MGVSIVGFMFLSHHFVSGGGGEKEGAGEGQKTQFSRSRVSVLISGHGADHEILNFESDAFMDEILRDLGRWRVVFVLFLHVERIEVICDGKADCDGLHIITDSLLLL